MQALLEFPEKEEKMENHIDSHPSQPVYRTKNYALFTLDRTNRPIDFPRVNRIAAQILAGKNLLSAYPIIVDANFNILDGQHRLEAAKLAGVEIYYIIDNAMTMELAAEAVSETKGWSIADRLHHYVQKGSVDYIRANNLWRQYDWLSVSTLVRICSSNGYQAEIFKNGKYKADRIEFARNVIEMAKSFEPYFDSWKTASFFNALMQVASTPGYQHRRMMEKMSYVSNKLHRHSRSDDYLDNLSEIYNHKVREENFLPFRSWKRVNPSTFKK